MKVIDTQNEIFQAVDDFILLWAIIEANRPILIQIYEKC